MPRLSKVYKYALSFGLFASIPTMLILSSFNETQQQNLIANSFQKTVQDGNSFFAQNANDLTEELYRAKKNKQKKSVQKIFIENEIKILENTISDSSLATLTFMETHNNKTVKSTSYPLAQSTFPVGIKLFPKTFQIRNNNRSFKIAISIPDEGANVSLQINSKVLIKNSNGKVLETIKEKEVITFTGPTQMQIDLKNYR